MMEILTSYWAERSLTHPSACKDQTGESGTQGKIIDLNIIMKIYQKRENLALSYNFNILEIFDI